MTEDWLDVLVAMLEAGARFFLVATTRRGGVNPGAQAAATANMILVENFFEELRWK